jgi:hypothetical protein
MSFELDDEFTAEPRESTSRARAPARMPASARAIARAVVRELARRGDGGVAEDAETLVDRAGGGGGAPLPAGLRQAFESSLGVDLGPVRVHDDGAAAAAATSVGARAYATGKDVFFAGGEYQPETPEGARLLAHEVAHTVQQRGGSPERRAKLSVTTPGDAVETEADRAADAMVAGRAFTIGGHAVAISRWANERMALPARDFISSAPLGVNQTIIQQLRAARARPVVQSGLLVAITLGIAGHPYGVLNTRVLHEDLHELEEEATRHGRSRPRR